MRRMKTAAAPKLGSFRDFMTGMAHVLQEAAPAAEPAPTPLESEAELYLELPVALKETDV